MKSRNQSKRPTLVLYSLAAQEDNLGDIVIRKRLLTWLDSQDYKLCLYVGAMSESYLRAYEIPPHIPIIRSKTKVAGLAVSSSFRNRLILVFPPGPKSFGGLKNSIRSLVLLIASYLTSLSGGGAILVGGSFRANGKDYWDLHRRFINSLKLCVVRDDNSGVGGNSMVKLAPDLGIYREPGFNQSNRFRLSISIRNDKKINSRLLEIMKNSGISNHLKLTLVTQVKRDDAQHKVLADSLGADLIEWSGDHSAQMERVREAYAESVVIVSDRLHALILGMNNGAYPVILKHPNVDKLTSTLNHVIDAPLMSTQEETLTPAFKERALENINSLQELNSTLDKVEDLLKEVEDEVLRVVRGE